jgi:hypothetical protein
MHLAGYIESLGSTSSNTMQDNLQVEQLILYWKPMAHYLSKNELQQHFIKTHSSPNKRRNNLNGKRWLSL